MKMTSVFSTIRVTIAIILWSLLFFHFIILFVYQLPPNPLNHRYKIFLERYINPNFSQKWSLFSPNPANSNQTIQINFIIFNKGQKHNSDWIDITTPLLKEKKNNFWTPTQRPLKFLNSCATNIIDLRSKIWEAATKDKTVKIDSERVENDVVRYLKRSQGNLGILGYAKIVYRKLSPTYNADSVIVQYKIMDAYFPRFSKRLSNHFEQTNYRYSYFMSPLIKMK